VDKDKLAYPCNQTLPTSPDGTPSGPSHAWEALSDQTESNIFFSEASEDSSEPTEWESGREA
jgi:hypothetical protein